LTPLFGEKKLIISATGFTRNKHHLFTIRVQWFTFSRHRLQGAAKK